jgi:ankyrin repeat protein
MKKDMQESRELLDACYWGNWEEAKSIIATNPQLVCTSSSDEGTAPTYWAAYHGQLDFLRHVLDVILFLWSSLHHESREKEEKEKQNMLRDAFERADIDEWAPVHGAACNGHVNCLAFLVEHVPSGEAVLEMKNYYGNTPAHFAADGQVDALDFIVRNALAGVGVLEVRNIKGETPVDYTRLRKRQAVQYIHKTKNNILPRLSNSGNNRGSARRETSRLVSTGRTIGDLQCTGP